MRSDGVVQLLVLTGCRCARKGQYEAAPEVILRRRELLPGEAACDHGKTLARSGGVITDLEWQAISARVLWLAEATHGALRRLVAPRLCPELNAALSRCETEVLGRGREHRQKKRRNAAYF
jgi:hypothetical protein